MSNHKKGHGKKHNGLLCPWLQHPVQKSEPGLNAGQAASDVTDLPNGSHTEADEESSAEQVNEDTQAKRQLLVKVAPLAGVWGLERFGLADVNILKLIEALPGLLV